MARNAVEQARAAPCSNDCLAVYDSKWKVAGWAATACTLMVTAIVLFTSSPRGSGTPPLVWTLAVGLGVALAIALFGGGAVYLAVRLISPGPRLLFCREGVWIAPLLHAPPGVIPWADVRHLLLRRRWRSPSQLRIALRDEHVVLTGLDRWHRLWIRVTQVSLARSGELVLDDLCFQAPFSDILRGVQARYHQELAHHHVELRFS